MKTTYAIALSFGMAAAANAVIITGVTASHSGTYTTDASGLVNITNGSGLSGPIVEDATAGGVTHGNGNILTDKWVTGDPGGAASDFFAQDAGTVQLDFALGGAQSIETAYVFGYYYFGNGNSATNIDISYSIDGTTFTGTESFSLTLPANSSTDPLAANVLSLNAVADSTHVRFLFTDNGFGAAGAEGGDRVGLGEVAFGTVVVPEPSSAALLGLGGLALILRRRK